MEDDAERRIVVFVGTRVGPATVEILESLVEALPHARFLVVRADDRDRRLRARLRRAGEQLRAAPLSTSFESVMRFTSWIASPFLPRPMPQRASDVSLPRLEELDNVWCVNFDVLHSKTCVEAVSKFMPWLGISIGAPVLHRTLFELPELGCINVHKSCLPEYRGRIPAFWEMHDEAEECGVSVHWVDERLDSGEVILQHKLRMPRYASLRGLRHRLDQVAIEVLRKSVAALDAGNATRKTQLVPRTEMRGRPPYLLRRKVMRAWRRKRRAGKSAGQRFFAQLRRLGLRSYVHLWTPARNLVRGLRGTQRTSILTYRRISEDFEDAFTTMVDDFDRQIDLLRKHYEILPLSTWLAERGQARQKPCAVVTFDCGYEDAVLAARLCRRHGIPATFFLATGIVGSEASFLHDIPKIGDAAPPVSWEQCKALAAKGFDFASNSVFHTDFTQADRDEVLEEIEQATRHLRNQFGLQARDRWLAVPFGKLAQLDTSYVQDFEKRGIEVVFDAAGGQNTSDFDLRAVARIPIDASMDLVDFRATLEGWRRAAPSYDEEQPSATDADETTDATV